jgi:hypothetical protein
MMAQHLKIGHDRFLLRPSHVIIYSYEGVYKSFRTGRLERELQMVQLSLDAVVSLFCESV